MMKPFNRYALFAAVLVVATGIWVATEQSDESGAADPTAMEPGESDQYKNVGEGAGSEEASIASTRRDESQASTFEAVDRRHQAVPDSRLAIMRAAESASSAVERAEALQRLRDIDPVLATMKLMGLAQTCSPDHLSAQGRLESERSFALGLREWCEGLQLSYDALEKRLAELTKVDDGLSGEDARVERLARNPYIGRHFEMEEAFSNAGDEERTEQFTLYLRRAADFEEIMSLIAFNSNHASDNQGQPFWRLGSDLQVDRYPRARLIDAQKVAIILFGCRRFGGCDPGQYLTMIFCLNNYFGQCARGTSLFEQIYQTTPPATYNLAREILARI
jgi:hypothetical protein